MQREPLHRGIIHLSKEHSGADVTYYFGEADLILSSHRWVRRNRTVYYCYDCKCGSILKEFDFAHYTLSTEVDSPICPYSENDHMVADIIW
jgi:hypothetical protein